MGTYEELRNEMTPEFLATLVRAARTVGHVVDYTEIVDFVHWCHACAEKMPPSEEAMEPFPLLDV